MQSGRPARYRFRRASTGPGVVLVGLRTLHPLARSALVVVLVLGALTGAGVALSARRCVRVRPLRGDGADRRGSTGPATGCCRRQSSLDATRPLPRAASCRCGDTCRAAVPTRIPPPGTSRAPGSLIPLRPPHPKTIRSGAVSAGVPAGSRLALVRLGGFWAVGTERRGSWSGLGAQGLVGMRPPADWQPSAAVRGGKLLRFGGYRCCNRWIIF
jgi:hypothetical protein